MHVPSRRLPTGAVALPETTKITRMNEDEIAYMMDYNAMHQPSMQHDPERYQREAKRALLGDCTAVVNSGLTCPRCHSNDIQYTLIASRSADEGMLPHCVCRRCVHSFVVSG